MLTNVPAPNNSETELFESNLSESDIQDAIDQYLIKLLIQSGETT